MGFRGRFPKVKNAGVLARMQYTALRDNPDIHVIGSYATGNVGDLAIGKSIVDNLHSHGIEAGFFSRKVRLPAGPVRVLGGGGVIHSYREKKVRRDLKLLTGDSMIIGVGVSPVSDEVLKNQIRQTVERLPVVTVRDERSKEALEDIVDQPVPALACPAFLLDVPEKETEGYTGISLRSLPLKALSDTTKKEELLQKHLGYKKDIQPEEIRKRFRQNIERVGDKFSNLEHIPFHHFDAEFIKKYNGIDGFEFEYSVESALSRVANANRMICMRYHSLVFSILCNKPSIAIAYAPKVACLAERAGIPYYKPYERIEFEFQRPTNRDAIISDAALNIDLIKRHAT